ncbi:MAG: hypothetical protein KGQ59_07050 [Bdellovibrionales bacterium]|nr:hypothetical protein [Bdellovibrionales bacterium]
MNKMIQRLLEWLQENQTAQLVRSKWDELDEQSRLYLKAAAAMSAALLVAWIFIGSWWQVRSIRAEIAEKDQILKQVQSARIEMQALRSGIPTTRSSQTDEQPWTSYFESIATSLGLDKQSLEVSTESTGQDRTLSKESFFDLTLKKVNVKQLTRFASQVENGPRPVKIQKLQVETKTDMSGYLDAKISVAVYFIKTST